MPSETCPCGRTHAPWWGRYIQAPSCKMTPKQEEQFFLDTLLELQQEAPAPQAEARAA